MTNLVNAVMQGRRTSGSTRRSSSRGTTGAASTTTSSRSAIDENGYGIRVPGIMISPSPDGVHRHQTLAFDAYLKLVEDGSWTVSGWTR